MRIWRGIGIISTMPSTRLWDCRWGVGWSRVRVSGSSSSASREWGCAGVRLDLIICYISGSPGSTARLRRCFRYSSNHPPTRNYARLPQVSIDKIHDVREAGLQSLEWAKTAGVQIGFGTDLLGETHHYQSLELSLRAQVLSPFEVLQSAT